MTHRAGVHDTLRHYPDPQVRAAVERVHQLVTRPAGTPVTSPFGLLVQWARSGHLTPPPIDNPRLADSRLATTADGDSDPAEGIAHDLVTRFEKEPERHRDDLAVLDRHITRTHQPHLATTSHPALRHALRVNAYLDLHADPAHPEATVSTSPAHPEHTSGTPMAVFEVTR